MSLKSIQFITDLASALFPLLGAFVILGEDLKRLWFKALLFSVIYGSLIFCTDYISLNIIRIISDVFISFLLIKYIFRLSNWFTLKMFIISNLLSFLAGFSGHYIVQYGFKIPFKQALLDKSIWLKVGLPAQILSLPVSFIFIGFRNQLRYFFAEIKDNLNVSVIRSLGLLIVIELVVFMSLISDLMLTIDFKISPGRALYIFLSVFLLLGINALILKKSVSASAAKTLEVAQDSISDNIMSLVNSVRSQRHDFINQIQVLNSLSHSGDMDGIKKYLSEMSGEISLYNNVLRIDNPIIGALINAKIIQAGLKDINLEVNITANLSHVSSKVLELTRILGNLLNNAIEAVEALSQPQKLIKLDINEKGPFIVFTVSNPCLQPIQYSTKLFEPGYTTKDENHSGLGLYICKQLAQKLHGSINYKYDPLSGISFSATIPKKL